MLWPVAPTFGPDVTLKFTVAPATAAPPELVAVAVTVCVPPGARSAVAGPRPTVLKSVASGAMSATGERINSASAALPATPSPQHEKSAGQLPPVKVVGFD